MAYCYESFQLVVVSGGLSAACDAKGLGLDPHTEAVMESLGLKQVLLAAHQNID